MLAQSDILVAVWDGKPADGRGGTGQIVDEAARRGVPIVVVDPANGATRMLWPDDPADETFPRRAEDIAPRTVESCLGAVVERLAAPPASPRERLGLAEYLSGGHGGAGAKGGSRASLVFDGRDVARSRSEWPRVSAAVAASPANLRRRETLFRGDAGGRGGRRAQRQPLSLPFHGELRRDRLRRLLRRRRGSLPQLA